jgi:hypothetical protein
MSTSNFHKAQDLITEDEMKTNVCMKCHRGYTHKLGYFCLDCEVEHMQISIGYIYKKNKPHWYRKRNETTLVDL